MYPKAVNFIPFAFETYTSNTIKTYPVFETEV